MDSERQRGRDRQDSSEKTLNGTLGMVAHASPWFSGCLKGAEASFWIFTVSGYKKQACTPHPLDGVTLMPHSSAWSRRF